ncbi:MAG: hypothetical protein PHY12_10460 [Eubacteriales bacterium]|nr:hypothetical protein [Eubacteriales bacterium]
MRIPLSAGFDSWIKEITCTDLPGAGPRAECVRESANRFLLRITAELEQETAAGDWQLCVRPAFAPDFSYTPHLTPTPEHVIDMHVFRTPALMMGQGGRVLCVMPVLDGVANDANRQYMDLDFPHRVMTLGITTTEVHEHVLYRRTNRAVLPKGAFCFEVRLLLLEGEEAANPYRSVLAFYWETYGRADCARLPACPALLPYVRYTYGWAFDRWKDSVWQEFTLNGRRVGAPQMIVTAQQSPNAHQPYSIREPVAIWNQAWFSSLRSAQGLYRYGKETGNDSHVAKALMTKELALQFPQTDGLFDSVIAVPSVTRRIDGQECMRGADWTQAYFGNSNRNPVTTSLREAPRHILDMSWTALQMLSWYEELEKDERLLTYALTFAERLLQLQDDDGFFPAWMDRQTGRVLPQLRQSPESAVSVTFLTRLYRLTGERRWLDGALRCMDALVRGVMPDSRWEDFETYWSCSRYGEDMQGKKFERNHCYKQCSLSPFWMAQALLECHQATREKRYLDLGERCLDEMLMYQSSFQPGYMPVTVVGGFGVMNCDAELNDARQSLFAELILQYGRLLGRDEYIERGSAALRASFSMMYCPENPLAKVQWEKKWPFFNERDYGFMMENYGHDGYVNGDSLGIGVFTIYDWGNGAASEAVLRIRSHFHELFEEGQHPCSLI